MVLDLLCSVRGHRDLDLDVKAAKTAEQCRQQSYIESACPYCRLLSSCRTDHPP